MQILVKAQVLRAAYLAAIATLMAGIAWSQDSTTDIEKMPRLKSMNTVEDYYPNVSRRYGEQGRVVLEFKISRKGRPVDPVIVEPGSSPALRDSARRLVKDLVFAVPADWEQSASGNHKYRLSVKYRLHYCAPAKPCDAKSIEPATDDPDVDSTITITSTLLAPQSK